MYIQIANFESLNREYRPPKQEHAKHCSICWSRTIRLGETSPPPQKKKKKKQTNLF